MKIQIFKVNFFGENKGKTLQVHKGENIDAFCVKLSGEWKGKKYQGGLVRASWIDEVNYSALSSPKRRNSFERYQSLFWAKAVYSLERDDVLKEL